MKKNTNSILYKKLFCGIPLLLAFSFLLACGDQTTTKKENDMVTNENSKKESTNSDYGTGGNLSATQDTSSLEVEPSSSEHPIKNAIDDAGNTVSNTMDDVGNGVEDIADGAGEVVNDAIDSTGNAIKDMTDTKTDDKNP